MNPTSITALDGIGAPYRSEAFAEDLFAADADDTAAPPWTWAQGGLAALLCAVPVGIALLGGAVGLIGAA
jgi:hypothetical protein